MHSSDAAQGGRFLKSEADLPDPVDLVDPLGLPRPVRPALNCQTPNDLTDPSHLCDPVSSMVGWPSVLLTAELGDLAEDVRKLFQELSRGAPARATAAGDCPPPHDVHETDHARRILIDNPGVAPHAVRVLLKGEVVLIAGEKWADAPGVGAGGHHLVERGSGRFARAVRVSGAFNGAAVTAVLVAGELSITLPKLTDRRGHGREIPVMVPNAIPDRDAAQ